jgi:septum formation protein
MLILASQSPRRKELLRNAGYEFIAISPMVEEIHRQGEAPEEYVERLARAKAMAVPAECSDWVLAADTTVVCGGALLEKPADAADAARMLRQLAGRRHDVLTGVCLRHQGHSQSAVERTGVWFDPLGELEIAEYVATGEPMDKAGAYGIQGMASKFVSRIDGCFFNVVGLPVARVRRLMSEAGYPFSHG